MADWEQVVEHFFRMSDPDGDCDHYAPSGASAEAIQVLESEIGVTLPDEFHDFYKHFDGIGLIVRDGTEMPLFLRPIREIPEYIEECRSVFSETHPADAERYFPFVDWWNGDSSGYLLNPDGTWRPFLCTFSHESYLYNDEQDFGEFVQPHSEGIEDLLSPE